ncbi:type VI secretion system Vgr family protein [Terrimonas rubra]|uniref:Type VI secretion system Vgr family protein n=1 Tax=Terrimonas rubra TaxID=1035890 RepID=A0ABW6A3R9_9BACT
MATNNEITTIKIQVSGTDGDISFAHLAIQQRLADLNTFSFTWRLPAEEASLSDKVNFYKNNLGKEVTININDSFTFKGIIEHINCTNQFLHNTEYAITGRGLLLKLDAIKQCKSFIKKTLKDIFEALGNGSPLKLEPAYTEQLFYTVQYNQTSFEFYTMLAARYGEWLYYNGEELVLGKPDTNAVELKLAEGAVTDLSLSARIQQAPTKVTGFDNYKGEYITSEVEAAKPGGSGMVDAALEASEAFYGKSQEPAFYGHSMKVEVLDKITELHQQASAASAVYITGNTRNNMIRIGGTIKVVDENDNATEFVVIELEIRSNGYEDYSNRFMAIPAESAVPPYTNPHLFPKSYAQLATVVDNEDADGLARIKVRMAWQPDGETTPWISVMVPHAGTDTGFRFLPEVDDEVMIDFIAQNAERPFVVGAVYSERNQSNIAHASNNLKIIGTRSGNRITFDDDAGSIKIVDKAGSFILLAGDGNIQIEAAKDLQITVAEKTQITIGSDMKCDVGANNELTIGSNNTLTVARSNTTTFGETNTVSIGSSQSITIGSNSTETIGGGLTIVSAAGTKLTDGASVEISAPSTKVEGAAAVEISGGATATLQGGATTTVKGGIVMIN